MRAAALRRHAEAEVVAELVRFGGKLDVIPTEALVDLIRGAAFNVASYEDLLQGEEPTTGRGRSLLDRYDGERDRLARLIKTGADIGLEERRVRLAEHQGNEIATRVLAGLADAEAALTLDQQKRALASIARHIRRLT